MLNKRISSSSSSCSYTLQYWLRSIIPTYNIHCGNVWCIIQVHKHAKYIAVNYSCTMVYDVHYDNA